MANDRIDSLTSFPCQSNRRAFRVLLTLAVVFNSANPTILVDRRLPGQTPGRSKSSLSSDPMGDETFTASSKQIKDFETHPESKTLREEDESGHAREPPRSSIIKSLEEKKPGESQAGYEKRMGKRPMLDEEPVKSIPAGDKLVIGNNNIRPGGNLRNEIPRTPSLTGVKSDASSELAAFKDPNNKNGEKSISSEVKSPAGGGSSNQETVKEKPGSVTLNTANNNAAKLDKATLGVLGVSGLGTIAVSVVTGITRANQQASSNNTTTPTASPTQQQNYPNDQFIPSSFTQPPIPASMYPIPQLGFRALSSSLSPRILRRSAASRPLCSYISLRHLHR